MDKKIVVGLEVSTGTSAAELEKVRDAAANIGKSGAQINQLANAFENVGNSAQRVDDKISEGRVVTERDGKAMIQQFLLLKSAIDSTFGSLSAAPPEIQAAFGKAQQQFETTTQKIREQTTVLKQHGEELKQGGVQWAGLGDAINKALGSFGGIQVGVLAGAAALKEGIKLGSEFAAAIGTDFSEAESSAANLKVSLKSVTNALTTNGLSAAVDTAAAAIKNLGDSVTGNGLAMKGYNALVLAGVKAGDAFALSTEQLAEIGAEHEKIIAGGADAQKLWNATIKDFDPEDYASHLAKLSGTFDELARKHKEDTDRRAEDKKAIDAEVGAIEAVIQKLKDEREAHRLGVDQLDLEIKERQAYKDALKAEAEAGERSKFVHNGLTDSMRSELEWLKKVAPEIDTNKEAVDRWAAALKHDAEVHNSDLSPATKQHIAQLEELIAKYKDNDPVARGQIEILIEQIEAENKAAEASKKHGAVIIDATGKITNLQGETEKTTVTLDEHTKTISNVSAETDKAAKGAAGFAAAQKAIQDVTNQLAGKSGTFSILNDNIGTLRTSAGDAAAKELKALDDKLIDIATHAKDAADRIAELGTAAHQAATGDGGGGTTKSKGGSGSSGGGETPSDYSGSTQAP